LTIIGECSLCGRVAPCNPFGENLYCPDCEDEERREYPESFKDEDEDENDDEYYP